MRRVSPPSPHQGVREEEGELVEKVEKEEEEASDNPLSLSPSNSEGQKKRKLGRGGRG